MDAQWEKVVGLGDKLVTAMEDGRDLSCCPECGVDKT